MHVKTKEANYAKSAIALALVLLCALAAGSWQVLTQVRMAPGTAIPAAALEDVANEQAEVPGNARPAPSTISGLPWSALSPREKEALAPLNVRWGFMGELQKRRWLALAQNFAALPQEEQEKLHSRMSEWASLSARQRSQARLNYADSSYMTRDDKLSRWEAYQALSTEEKRKLAESAKPKPQGAAIAVRPVAPKKLAQVPAATQASPSRPNPPKIPPVAEISPRMAVPPPIPTPAQPTESRPTTASQADVETAPVNTPEAVPQPLPLLSTGQDGAAPPADSSQPAP